MKNITCAHCNLNKICYKEMFFWPTQNNFKENMTFKVDNHFGTKGILSLQFIPGFTLHVRWLYFFLNTVIVILNKEGDIIEA